MTATRAPRVDADPRPGIVEQGGRHVLLGGRCVSCGHETHGWELDAERPAVRLRAEGPRNALQRAPLVSERKIA